MSDEKPADVLSKVLSYVDSPFKLFALILMAVFAFSGYFVWQNQELLMGAYKESKRMPSIVEDRVEDADVVKLMASEIPCGEYKSAQSEMGLWYIAKGVTYTCRISIPPDPSRFVGQITVGWDNEPADIQVARTMMEIAATMLSRSKQ